MPFSILFFFSIFMWLYFVLQCLTADDLGINVKSVLNETGFAEKAPMIVYSLMPEKNSGQSNNVCDGIPSFPGKLFETFVQNFTNGEAKGITHHALERILERINVTLSAHLHKRKVSEVSFEHYSFKETNFLLWIWLTCLILLPSNLFLFQV